MNNYVKILNHTTVNPITLIGEMAGVCWSSDVSDEEKNYLRGLDCLKSKHGRTFEFPDIYMVIDGYSARVIRELYTHIGGAPTRLQSSTRYINYENGFDYVIPDSVLKNEKSKNIYIENMDSILDSMKKLNELDIPREDIAMCLPLGMTSKIVTKYNLRTILDMAHQRKCSRAYWEYRKLFNNIEKELSEYSEEWYILVRDYFKCKCDTLGFCEEKKSCGKYPNKEIKNGE